MLLSSQEWGGVENNTPHESLNPDCNVGKILFELDCRARGSELGWWSTPEKIDDDLAN